MIEIERKFLVNSFSFINIATQKNEISQGYLNSNPERTVRIRLKDTKGFLTIKGKSNESGTSRFEWEKEIDFNDAKSLLILCEDFVLSKTRYLVPIEKHIYEVDVFHGDNDGLIIAEIELQQENETFIKPEWLGEEVTGKKEYYNSYLANHPFLTWK